jgi:hypothetical protein
MAAPPHVVGHVGVTWPLLLPEFLVEVGQLLVELTPGFGEFIEAFPALGIRGMAARC